MVKNDMCLACGLCCRHEEGIILGPEEAGPFFVSVLSTLTGAKLVKGQVGDTYEVVFTTPGCPHLHPTAGCRLYNDRKRPRACRAYPLQPVPITGTSYPEVMKERYPNAIVPAGACLKGYEVRPLKNGVPPETDPLVGFVANILGSWCPDGDIDDVLAHPTSEHYPEYVKLISKAAALIKK